MAKNRKTPNMNFPVWFDGQNINEALFCEEFLHERRIIFANGAFFTPDGRVTDDLPLRGEIYDKLKFCAVNNIPRKITNILEVLKLEAQVSDFPPEQDRIHVANGTLLLNGTFTEGRPAIVRSRLPVGYNPDAPAPVIWLNFLDGLLYAEDIPTLQEFIGYCLIPSNKGQRMMVIKGNGGEGKSQIGAVLSTIFGTNMKDGSIGKISENRFARADLEHILLCVDDDMRMEALRQTNYVKSIVTAQGKMDLERKGKQSYQGWMFARLLAFSNGDLQALYDRSDGFYRRQLVLTTKEKQVDRADDPDLAEKMKAEAEGIFSQLSCPNFSKIVSRYSGVSHFAGADAAGRDGVLRERGESLFARRLFRVLRHGVLCRAGLPRGLHGHHGACVPESQPRTDLSAHRLSGGGDNHSDRAAAAARDMAVRHAAFGALLHLLQRDVEPARRADRPFESEQLSQSRGGNVPQRRGARRLRCGRFQAGQRPIWPRERRYLPCRDRRVHQASLCASRLLLPHGRR